jgi:dephospho-CoA kinase
VVPRVVACLHALRSPTDGGTAVVTLASRLVLLIGLTGGIGSGKSTVSVRLAELGAVVIDADAITKELQQPGTEVFDAMVERFGDGILAADGTLDRQAVADIVFADADALADLNAIVHPAVGLEIARRMQTGTDSDRVVVLDVPLLVESGRSDLTALVVVDVDPEVAVRRLVEHRGMREDDVRARIARQASREDRLAKADHVLDNSGTLEELQAQVDALWEELSGLTAR